MRIRIDELMHAIETASSLLAGEEVEWAITFDERGEPIALVEGTETIVYPKPGYMIFHNHPDWADAWPSVGDVYAFVRAYPRTECEGVLSGDGRQYFLMWVSDPEAMAGAHSPEGEDVFQQEDETSHASPALLRRLGISWEVGTWDGEVWDTIFEALPVHIPLRRSR